MIYKAFQDLQLSQLGFGTMRLPLREDKSIDEELAAAMTDAAIRQGVNYFDTAWPYHSGKSETVIGKILQNYPRESFYLADKFPGHQIAPAYDVADIFERQLKKCGVEYFDFYLLHNVYENSIGVYEDARWNIIPYLLEQGLSMDEILDGLCKNGGLKGISGTSGDLRDVQTAADAGSARAKLAMEVYVTQLLRYIGAYFMELSGVDAIAFTGGIGENSWRLREMVLDRLAHIGVKYDRALNRRVSGEQLISTPDSAVAVHVIPANEELMVVRAVWTWLNNSERK